MTDDEIEKQLVEARRRMLIRDREDERAGIPFASELPHEQINVILQALLYGAQLERFEPIFDAYSMLTDVRDGLEMLFEMQHEISERDATNHPEGE